MTILTLGWVESRGAVRFLVDTILATQAVRRVTPSGLLQSIRGYPDGKWWTATVPYGYDYEAPLGVGVRYVVVDKAATQLENIVPAAGPVEILTETPGMVHGEAWLRDVLVPDLSMQVTVVSTNDETRSTRNTIYEIAGKKTPFMVWDIRTARQGVITLLIQDRPIPGVWSRSTIRSKLEALLDSSRPLLFSMTHDRGFPPCYTAVQDAVFTRVGMKANWTVELNYREVDNPISLQNVRVAIETTYEQAAQIPPGALYADWAAGGATYFDIATRISVPSAVIAEASPA